MTTQAAPQARPGGVQVTRVYFTAPSVSAGGCGPEFDTWQAAIDQARSTIRRFEYRGQVVDKADPYYHPRRCFQEEDICVHYSRAFAELRVTEPVQDRPGQMRSGLDHPVITWEVFQDGTVEILRESPPTAGNR